MSKNPKDGSIIILELKTTLYIDKNEYNGFLITVDIVINQKSD